MAWLTLIADTDAEHAEALSDALLAAVLHAVWNLLLARERDTQAATAVAVVAPVIVFAPVTALVWDVDGRVWPFVVATSCLQLLYFALRVFGGQRREE